VTPHAIPTTRVGRSRRYGRHVSSLLQEVTAVGAYQRMRLEEYVHQVEAKHRLIAELQKGNRDLLQQTHTLERCNKELHDDLLRTYHSLNLKTDTLDSTHT
jgi:cell division protein FtsB